MYRTLEECTCDPDDDSLGAKLLVSVTSPVELSVEYNEFVGSAVWLALPVETQLCSALGVIVTDTDEVEDMLATAVWAAESVLEPEGHAECDEDPLTDFDLMGVTDTELLGVVVREPRTEELTL